MARAYSNDLRRKFLQAYEKGKGTLGELAERFGVSVGWAKKISAAYTRTGQVERPPWRRGPVSRVTPAVQEWMREQIRRRPDVTLMELQQQLEQSRGVGLSIGRLWRALQQMGLRLKKSHSTPRNKRRRKRSSAGRHQDRSLKSSRLRCGLRDPVTWWPKSPHCLVTVPHIRPLLAYVGESPSPTGLE